MTAAPLDQTHALDLAPGEMVRVRQASEIFATLDDAGELDGLAFMPEMLQYCGRTFSVSQRADRTCAGDGIVRRMPDAVHLTDVRCDGASHGGCQAACLMYWKEAWLERAGSNGVAPRQASDIDNDAFITGTLLPMTTQGKFPDGGIHYRCQATEIKRSAGDVWRFREVGQYSKDVENWNLRIVLRGVLIELFNIWQDVSNKLLPKALRIAEGRRYPWVRGALKKGETPRETLDLQAGDLVRIKSKDEIVATLDEENHNRGLSFDGEMANWCGRTARVRSRVSRIVEERTGEFLEFKSDCIILEGVVCTGDYHRFCTRAIYPYWREIWLERVTEPTVVNGSAAAPVCGSGDRVCS